MTRLRLISALVFVLAGSVRAGTYSGGTGEPNDPYTIATANDLNDIGNHVEDYNKCFILVNDINMDGFTYTRAVIAPRIFGPAVYPPFTGVFNGNDCNICNLTIETGGTSNQYLGLFGQIGETGEVKNLGIEDANITGGDYSSLGALCALNGGTITNCYVTGSVTGRNDSAGGLVEYNSGQIANCYATASVSGSINVGGLVGHNSSQITNCYATGNVFGHDCLGGLVAINRGQIANSYATGSVTGGDDSQHVGGLCGANAGGIIFNCYAVSNVNGGDECLYLGGLCGGNYSGIISHTYATGSVTGGDNSDYLGGLCGENEFQSTIGHCYSIGSVTGGNNSLNLGGLCGGNSGSISNCFWDVNRSEQATSAGGTGLTTVQMKQQSSFIGWDFLGETANGTSDLWMNEPNQYPELTVLSDSFSPYVFSGGSGTELDPYQVCSAPDLGAIWQYPQACFVLTDDINLAGIEWFQGVIPIFSTFDGKFNGNGFRISNLSMFGGNYLGLFAKIGSGGEVKDLVIDNATIVNSEDSEYFGGLCGWNRGTISDCNVQVSITGGDNSLNFGGLVGKNYSGGMINNCCASGSVTGGNNSRYFGVLCGNNVGTISNSYATGNIQGGNYIGGLCGGNYHGTISDCYATGSVTSGDSSRALGGLCGDNSYDSIISDCYATGSVTSGDGSIELGGLCGQNYNATISNCYATGSVSGGDNSQLIGGLCGDNFYGTISNSYAKGSVTGDYSKRLGGFCGRNEGGTISNSYATGEVFAGGTSWQSYHYYHYYSRLNFDTVVINGISYRCLASHTSSSSFEDDLAAGYWMPTTGGLVGRNSSKVRYSFWDINSSGINVSDGGTGLTTVDMQTKTTFTDAGWDFTTPIWIMCDEPDYPRLWWECPPMIEVAMKFTPQALNPGSQGNWMKAHFVLPEGYAVEDVDVNTPAVVKPGDIESDYMNVFINDDGLVEIEAAFDRAEFCSIVTGGEPLEVRVVGSLTSGRQFYGTDTIKITTNIFEYLAVLASHWLEAECGKPDWCGGADVDQDSLVNFSDFVLFDGCCIEVVTK